MIPGMDASDPELPDRALGRRIGGALLDLVVLSVLLFAVGAVVGGTETGNGQISVHLNGGGLAAFVIVSLLYFIVFELLVGATIGKLLVGVRVRSEDVGRPAAWQVIVRNLLRPIDVLPALYLIGYLVLMASGPTRRQRIGDRVARTIVVPRTALEAPPTGA